MKKLKSFLCGVLAFLAGSVVLSACDGTKLEDVTQQEQSEQQAEIDPGERQDPEIPVEPNEPTTTIISLAEAKEIITAAVGDNFNATMGKLFIRLDINGSSGINLYSQYNESGVLMRVLLHYDDDYPMETKDWYLADGVQYGNDVESGVRAEELPAGWIGIDLSVLFTNGFTVYHEQVQKNTNNDGFTLTLHTDWESSIYLDKLINGYSDEYWREYGDEVIKQEQERVSYPRGGADLLLMFDNNGGIVNGKLVWNGSSEEMAKTLVGGYYFEKTDIEIVEPDWVTEYKSTHSA